MTDEPKPEPKSDECETQSSDSPVRQILLSLMVVALCWVCLRFGSLIVSVAITHIWHADDPILSAYAFVFRQLIATFIYPSVLSVFRPAFIPLYNEIKQAEGEESASRFAAGVVEIGMLLGLAIFAWIWLAPGLTVHLLAPHFSPEQYEASVRMIRQMGPGILCLLFAEMYLLVFHGEKKFAYPHGAEALQKIAWGIGIVVTARFLGWKTSAIGVAYSVACALQLAVNVVGMFRSFGWAFRAVGLTTWGAKWGRRACKLALPLLAGIAAARLRDGFTLRVQSHLDSVRFVGVEFARQMTNLPVAFLGQIVSIVMLPYLASMLHEHGKDAHRRTLEGTVETMWLLSIPIIAVTLVLAPELMALLFINAHWVQADFVFCAQGALAARMIALGFTFMVLENILLPGLFSIQSMWWPVIWGVVASVFQIFCLVGLSMAALPKDSTVLLAGVALVYPLSRIFKNSILLLVLRQKTNVFPGPRLFALVTKMLALTAATVAMTYGLHKLCSKFLGTIPTDVDVVPYKIKLLLQLGVPTAFMFVGFALLVILAGYRERIVTLIQIIRRKRSRTPVDKVPTEPPK